MSYFESKKVDYSYEDAVEKTKEALKKQGFGVITEIDMQAVFKNKLDKEIPSYIILGACNPDYAYQAVQAEDNIGLMLPCNVIVREDKEGIINVSVVDPLEAMKTVENKELEGMSIEVRDKLIKALADL
jgi:uncharacterized protein (DUF302 family)